MDKLFLIVIRNHTGKAVWEVILRGPEARSQRKELQAFIELPPSLAFLTGVNGSIVNNVIPNYAQQEARANQSQELIIKDPYAIDCQLFTPTSASKETHTAMTTQHKLTYGLSRSPTRAHFQKIPKILKARAVNKHGCHSAEASKINSPFSVAIHYLRKGSMCICGSADD